ncbi:MAG: alpha/beta hydrolase [Nitrospirae bacterium]|nr:alpha/beta hydrolase [Nitrospirota bacterium]
MLLRLVLIIFAALVGFYLFITVFLYLFQSKYVFVPFREIAARPSSIGLDYEDIKFDSIDGIRLSGWYVPAKAGNKYLHHNALQGLGCSPNVILFCHGNAGNNSHILGTLKIFNDLGLDTFVFDYRGYGESAGSPSEQGTYNDALSAWNYLLEKRGIPPEKIIIFGRSLGGSIASWLAKEHTPKALIIESTFVSMESLFKAIYPYLPIKLLLKYNYKTLVYLKDVTCPVLVIHSPQDELVPFSQGLSLYENITEKKLFLQISGDHIDGFSTSGNVYINGLRGFIFSDSYKDK